MQIIADLHLHSKFSRAVSPEMVISEMSKQAARKGIDLLATGDWFHSVWLKQAEADLEEWSEGVYQSRENPSGAKFILSAEISNIFTAGGKSRRVHTLVFSPNFSVSHSIDQELIKRGCNLSSDGRPIIGLTLEELAEVVFSVDERCMMIPAHVWTPWFSVYGSKSGFDSIGEAYGKYSDSIFAVETGLSSDPSMNWRINELKRRAIVSFSDAHSGAKLGREATVLQTVNPKSPRQGAGRQIPNSKRSQNTNIKIQNYTYHDVYWAVAERFLGKNEGSMEIAYTIEFYPEEGKYHYSGHRKCGVVQSPEQTVKRGANCSVCGRPLTLGVMHRVRELADRDLKPVVRTGKTGVAGYFHPEDDTRPAYVMLVPLQEILAEVQGVGSGSKAVVLEFDRLIRHFGSEFEVLIKADLSEVEKIGGGRFAEALSKVRDGSIHVEPGYDGVFGMVQIWGSGKEQTIGNEQMGLF